MERHAYREAIGRRVAAENAVAELREKHYSRSDRVLKKSDALLEQLKGDLRDAQEKEQWSRVRALLDDCLHLRLDAGCCVPDGEMLRALRDYNAAVKSQREAWAALKAAKRA